MTAPLDQIALHLVAAVLCGSLIGTERQARQRMAGVRTNALVALGAASFVSFASLFPGDASPTRVAAQIVSGIGFLGAGIIFRDGLNVHGLNTAATLWCSAAVGMLCGTGALDIAALLTGILLLINIGLRPLVNWLDRHMVSGLRPQRQYRVDLVAAPDRQDAVRTALVQHLTRAGFAPSAVEVDLSRDADSVAIAATVTAGDGAMADLERAVAALTGQPGLLRARWHRLDDG